MHTTISQNNPYSYSRYGFAWEHVPYGSEAHLDFGCFDGKFLNKLKVKNVKRLVGVDINQDAVEKGHQRSPDLEIKHISKTLPIFFGDGVFSSITVLDVVEHVYEQKFLLRELNRVLKKNGKLIITVPGQHLFSFLDIGNFKFIFPRLHRWYYCILHSSEEYKYHYVSNPYGLVGDVSVLKRWHEHFSREKLKRLLEETGFSIIDFDGTGFFSRIINIFSLIKPLRSALSRIRQLDAKLFESSNLFCLAEKC